jgi:hypothetical protein
MRPYLKNIYQKKGLVEWLKVKALNSSPSTKKKKKKKARITGVSHWCPIWDDSLKVSEPQFPHH